MARVPDREVETWLYDSLSARVGFDVVLSADTRLQEDVGLGSLEAIELLVAIEDRFGVVINDEEARTIATVGHLASIVSTRRDGG
jgi:acyl carrier protein